MKVDYWSPTKKIQLKENSTESSAENNLKENLNSKNPETFLWNKKKKKKKEKYSNSNNFVSRTLSNKFPANSTCGGEMYLVFSVDVRP